MENPKLWWPQWRFEHHAADPKELEQLSSSGGLAGYFSSTRLGPDQFVVSGMQTRDLSIWHTSSVRGFVSRPKLRAEVITFRSIEAGSLTRIDQDYILTANCGDLILTRLESMREDVASEHFASLSVSFDLKSLSLAYELIHQKPFNISQLSLIMHKDDMTAPSIRYGIMRAYNYIVNYNVDNDHFSALIRDIFLLSLVAAWPSSAASQVAIKSKIIGPRSLNEAVDYINNNLARPITLTEISTLLNVSPRALQKSFKQKIGLTPLAYIIQKRLEAVSYELKLIDDSRPIRVVAERWGFNNMSDFSRRFKAQFGFTPREFRKRR